MIKVKTEQAKTTLTTTHSSVQLEGEIQGCRQQDSVPVWHQGVMVEALHHHGATVHRHQRQLASETTSAASLSWNWR